MINGLTSSWRLIISNNCQRIIRIAGHMVGNQTISNESRVTELVSVDRKLKNHAINPMHLSQNIPVITGHRPANCDLFKIPTQRRGKNQHRRPSLFYTNCRSLNHDKLTDLAVHIQETNPDIICLTETWLTESNQHTASISDYNHFWAHRKDRTDGGVYMYVKDNLPSKQLLSLSTSTFSAVWILIRTADNQKTIYCCVYHPPDSPKISVMILGITCLTQHRNF